LTGSQALRVAITVSREVLGLFRDVPSRMVSPVRHPGGAGRQWWQRPGVGIQYQIEYRPGMDWERDYRQFNRSMMDREGALDFNGPFCQVEDWVELSKKTGADYHIMEIKWHDGICYFDTALTDWKTPEDYARRFAGASRKAGIPFMFYYSSVFDHNPMFDAIQPAPGHTISFIGYKEQYVDYMRAQYREIMDKYAPDGLWIDWYWPDDATGATVDLFRSEYPDAVLAFNASNYFPSARRLLHYTSGEAHNLDGRYFKLVKMERGIVPMFASCWKWATILRRLLPPPWELIAPAGRWWQDPSLREDPKDLVRMAAIVMANGGLFFAGVTSKLDGSIFSDQIMQLGILGDWYLPRKPLFTGSVPARYRRREPPGVHVKPGSFRTAACVHGRDKLLHLFNMKGYRGPVVVELRGSQFERVRSAIVEPGGTRLDVIRVQDCGRLEVPAELSDPVDTILRLESD
jgi:alpha-L-fucosidase